MHDCIAPKLQQKSMLLITPNTLLWPVGNYTKTIPKKEKILWYAGTPDTLCEWKMTPVQLQIRPVGLGLGQVISAYVIIKQTTFE